MNSISQIVRGIQCSIGQFFASATQAAERLVSESPSTTAYNRPALQTTLRDQLQAPSNRGLFSKVSNFFQSNRSANLNQIAGITMGAGVLAVVAVVAPRVNPILGLGLAVLAVAAGCSASVSDSQATHSSDMVDQITRLSCQAASQCDRNASQVRVNPSTFNQNACEEALRSPTNPAGRQIWDEFGLLAGEGEVTAQQLRERIDNGSVTVNQEEWNRCQQALASTSQDEGELIEDFSNVENIIPASCSTVLSQR